MSSMRDDTNVTRPERRGHSVVSTSCSRPLDRRNSRINHDRLDGRIIKEQHRMGEKAVPAPNIDDAPAATHTPHAPRGFPGFEQFLARQAAGMADGAGQSMKQRVTGKRPRS
jgi:hypothetical protein